MAKHRSPLKTNTVHSNYCNCIEITKLASDNFFHLLFGINLTQNWLISSSSFTISKTSSITSTPVAGGSPILLAQTNFLVSPGLALAHYVTEQLTFHC